MKKFYTWFLVQENRKWLKKKFVGNSLDSGWIGQFFIYALLIGISYIFLFPLLKMISMAFMSQTDLINPEVDWIPQTLNFGNFVIVERVLQLLPPSWAYWRSDFFGALIGTFTNAGALFQSIRNNALLAITQTVISALTAFAFARYDFQGKKFWFVMVLLSFVIPLPMVMVPRIMEIVLLQDSVWVPFVELLGPVADFLKIPPTFFGSNIPAFLFALFGQGVNSAILILIFYNFFRMIPIVLDEAARVDGATHWQTFFHIYIKLMTPIIVTVFLFSFVWNWNDTFTATVFFSTNNPSVTMRLGAFDALFDSRANSGGGAGEAQFRISEAYKMAATLVSMLPLFIMYTFAQRQFIEGIERTGIAGE